MNPMKGKLTELLALFVMGGLGGSARYLHHWLKGTKFSWPFFITNISLAGFVGILAGTMVPITSNLHDVVVGVAGFLATQILDVLDRRGAQIVDTFIKVRIEETKNLNNDKPTEAIMKIEAAPTVEALQDNSSSS